MIIENDVEKLTDRYMQSYNDIPRYMARNIFLVKPKNFIANKYMVIMFVFISDSTLDRIKNNPLIMCDVDFLKFCYTENGKNIYLIKGFGNSKGYRSIIKYLISKYNPETISFHRDDFKKIHIAYKGEKVCLG